MPVTHQYLRWSASEVFGITASPEVPPLFCPTLWPGQTVVATANERVLVWNMRTQQLVEDIEAIAERKVTITSLHALLSRKCLIVGYQDGKLSVYDVEKKTVRFTVTGHKTSVSCLASNDTELLFASGGRDTHIVIWDLVNESGLYKLRGHKGGITDLAWLSTSHTLISGSRDSFVKFWDLDTQHCFATIVEHRGEVASVAVSRDGSRLITGSDDNQMRVWRLAAGSRAEEDEDGQKPTKIDVEEDEWAEVDAAQGPVKFSYAGALTWPGKGSVRHVQAFSKYMAVCGKDNKVVVFRLNSKEEIQKRLAKKAKKLRKRGGSELQDDDASVPLDDEIRTVTTVQFSGRVASFDVVVAHQARDTIVFRVVATLTNNNLESQLVSVKEHQTDAEVVKKLSQAALGHRSDVRCLAVSKDTFAIASASGEQLKVWNRSSLRCIRTIDCEYATCCLFAPGDRHVIVGTKSGLLQVFDIASAELLNTVTAHEDVTLWAMCLNARRTGLITGGADKIVKFWSFEVLGENSLVISQSRQLVLEEEVLAVAVSPDDLVFAVALLDSTVKVFHNDTMKFSLSLYGHKLPVLSIDISSDSRLIATASADRNVKLWGLDFGDCHKSIFAHDESVTSVRFMPDSHQFFSAGKDGEVKQWDGDSFKLIQTLKGHCREVWSLALSPDGRFLVTSSHDKSLRLWRKTDEMLVLEEEEEIAREKELEKELATGEEAVIAGESNPEVTLATLKTSDTMAGAEYLMDSIDMWRARRDDPAGAAVSQAAILTAMRLKTVEDHFLVMLKRVRSAELEQTMLLLPFDYAVDALHPLRRLIAAGHDVELCTRTLLFIVKVYQAQLVATESLVPTIELLKTKLPEHLKSSRDVFAFNYYAMTLLKHRIEERENIQLFADATEAVSKKMKKKARKAVISRVV